MTTELDSVHKEIEMFTSSFNYDDKNRSGQQVDFGRIQIVKICDLILNLISSELTWEEAKRLCPPGVVAACHNSQDSVTISGGAQEMAKFMAELTAQGIMVKEVNSSNISYHSPHMKKLSVDLKNGLEKVGVVFIYFNCCLVIVAFL